ncbi:MAG: hypothetical protein QM783_14900 [Phycisphaerales bacterium]
MNRIAIRCSFTALAALAAMTCANRAVLAQTWTELGDAGQNGVAAAQNTVGSGPLTQIQGVLTGFSDVDVFCIEVTDHTTFRAFVGGFGGDSMLWLFNPSGTLQVWNDNASVFAQEGDIGEQGVFSNGIYYLAISNYNLQPRDAANTSLTLTTLWPGPQYQQRQGTTGTLDHWTALNSGPPMESYRIALISAAFAPAPGAGAAPVLGGLAAVRRPRRR